MRNATANRYAPCLNFDPVAIFLIDDLVVQFKKGLDTKFFKHGEYISG